MMHVCLVCLFIVEIAQRGMWAWTDVANAGHV